MLFKRVGGSITKIILPFIYKILQFLKGNTRAINFLNEKKINSNNVYNFQKEINKILENKKLVGLDIGAQGGFNSDDFFPKKYNGDSQVETVWQIFDFPEALCIDMFGKEVLQKVIVEIQKYLQMELNPIEKTFFENKLESYQKIDMESTPKIKSKFADLSVKNSGLKTKLIFEVKKDRFLNADQRSLFNEQTRLIGMMNKRLTSNVFSNFVPGYKSLATISQTRSISCLMENPTKTATATHGAVMTTTTLLTTTQLSMQHG